VFAEPSLNAFMATGRGRWSEVRATITELLTGDQHRGTVEAALRPLSAVRLHLPFTPGDYVDFFGNEYHAANAGRIFRPDGEPLTPNWKHMPIGYHGRSGTIVPSGTPVTRPCGQRRGSGGPTFGPSRRLDFEAEVGFVVGAGSSGPVSVGAFADHVFGVFLLNDWSARDLQAWESQPLGPFLAKSFATSVSPWVVPLEALEHAWVSPPPRDPEPLPYLADVGQQGLDLALEVRLDGHLVASPPYAGTYWTAAQMLAHMTVNGAPARTGDLFASGTVSGPDRDQRGCLLELSWGGAEPLTLPDGSVRTFLEDGDEVTITATAPAADGTRIGFGEVTGQIRPAASPAGSGPLGQIDLEERALIIVHDPGRARPPLEPARPGARHDMAEPGGRVGLEPAVLHGHRAFPAARQAPGDPLRGHVRARALLAPRGHEQRGGVPDDPRGEGLRERHQADPVRLQALDRADFVAIDLEACDQRHHFSIFLYRTSGLPARPHSSMREPTMRVPSRGSWKYSAASAVMREVAMNSRLRQRLMPGVLPGTISMRDRK
jgi:fumarylacetoacetase